MAGPERRFIDRVHRPLAPEVYKECSTGTMGSNGTPDYYYEGCADTLRIEYKAVDGKLPDVIELINPKKKYALSPLQRRWLNRAHSNGVPVAVVLGSNEGGFIFDNGGWEKKHSRSKCTLYSPKEIAEYIRETVT